MLAKIKAGQTSGEVTYVTEETFIESLSKKHGELVFEVQQEAIHWAKSVGRIGSWWQQGNIIHVKVEKEGDDPFQYYHPSDFTSVLTSKTWTDPSGCKSGGCSGGCDSC